MDEMQMDCLSGECPTGKYHILNSSRTGWYNLYMHVMFYFLDTGFVCFCAY